MAIIDTIGPVFSNWGLRNWDLCLAEKEIIAFPRSLSLTFKAGALAGMGNIVGAQRAWSAQETATGSRTITEKEGYKWRRYMIENLEAIIIQRRWLSASEVRLKQHQQNSHVYGVIDYHEILRARLVLSDLYPRLYSEQGSWPSIP